jgi:SAM-dependent methyltransferase
MSRVRARRSFLTAALLAAAAAAQTAQAQDVPFLESPDSVVQAMLELAGVAASDVVYDLGSGDGRIVIAAAAQRGARGVGIELEADLVARSEESARAAGVAERVRFVRGDFFEADFREATVVTLYLLPEVNRRLRPRLAEQLAPGTRVVSHRYEIQGWSPVERIKVEGRPIYLYVVPGARPGAGERLRDSGGLPPRLGRTGAFATRADSRPPRRGRTRVAPVGFFLGGCRGRHGTLNRG